jgi:hypothetical protein
MSVSTGRMCASGDQRGRVSVNLVNQFSECDSSFPDTGRWCNPFSPALEVSCRTPSYESLSALSSATPQSKLGTSDCFRMRKLRITTAETVRGDKGLSSTVCSANICPSARSSAHHSLILETGEAWNCAVRHNFLRAVCGTPNSESIPNEHTVMGHYVRKRMPH